MGVTLAPMDVQTRKWTRAEYERLVEVEILGPEDRVELLGGAMICKEPQYSPHATSILLVQRALTETFGSGWVVRSQMPVALDELDGFYAGFGPRLPAPIRETLADTRRRGETVADEQDQRGSRAWGRLHRECSTYLI